MFAHGEFDTANVTAYDQIALPTLVVQDQMGAIGHVARILGGLVESIQDKRDRIAEETARSTPQSVCVPTCEGMSPKMQVRRSVIAGVREEADC